MHKKDQVKDVIAAQIKKGRDFFELTPSFLENLDELKGFSERTLKRGRTEYKLEHPELMKKHSRNTASIKKKIFKQLDDAPSTTPKELSAMFPDVDKSVLTRTRSLWKKENSLQQETQTAQSLRDRVFDFLIQNPKASLLKLTRAFPGQERKILGDYLEQWRQAQPPKKKKVSLKQRIMEYLNANPGTTLKQLREAFSDTKTASINTYYSLWKNNRIQDAQMDPPVSDGQLMIRDGDSEIVKALKTTIEAQRKTIEVLKSQNDILRQRQEVNFPELEGMTRDEVKTVERVIRTFIKGIKNI